MALLLGFSIACQQDEDTETPVSVEPTVAQPYSGLEVREVRALAPERVDDLLAGRGAGYALTAELNHFPGPTHVLDMQTQLQLTDDQKDAVESIKAPMKGQAMELGTQLVELEGRLDSAFRSGEITSSNLRTLTSEIAAVEGDLRNVHLQAHLLTVEILTESQVERYDELRGYDGDDSGSSSSIGEHVMPEGHDVPQETKK